MTDKEAIFYLKQVREDYEGKEFVEGKEALDLAIKALEERPQGEWLLLRTNYEDSGNNFYECTNCHYRDIHAGSAEVPFCWHCGADMRKEGVE